MSLACKDIAGLTAAAKKLIDYEKVVYQWLTGPANQNIVFDGVTFPTLRKLITTIDERNSQIAQQVVDDGLAQITVIKNRMTALAEEINAKADKLIAMQVSVEMLAEGATALGTYDNDTGVLTLQIPRGFTGNDGKQGPQGQAPVIDVINCGKAQTEWITVLDGGQADTYEVVNA